MDWRQWACRLLVERYGSLEASSDGMHAPLHLLELCFEGFVQQVIAEYPLPRLRSYSLMEFVDEISDALDEYLLED